MPRKRTREAEEEAPLELPEDIRAVAERHLADLRGKLQDIEQRMRQLERERRVVSSLIYRYNLVAGRSLPRLTQAVARLLEEEGRPLSVKEMQERLKAMGYPPTSLGGVLTGTLYTSKRFVPVRRGLWRLASPEEQERRAAELARKRERRALERSRELMAAAERRMREEKEG